jgi:RNA polymerase sigma factor (sigma-70 family)
MNIQEDKVVDEFLVMRCQAGDRTALAALITKWQPPFLRYASVMTRDKDLAADVLQEAWIKIVRSLPRLKDPLKFSPWAYRIISNQCLDELRKQKRQEITLVPLEQSEFNKFAEHEHVWRILEQLSPNHRSVLALHYLQEFEIKEIAGILRKPQGTVKSRLFNARERFKQIFEEQEAIGDRNEQSGQSDTSGFKGSY